MANPSIRAASVYTGASRTSLTVTKPTGTVDNDILLFSVYIESDAAFTGPAGATLLYTLECNVAGGAYRQYVWWKRASGEGADYALSWGGGNVWTGAWCGAIKDCVLTGDPWDAHDGHVKDTATNTQFPATSVAVAANQRFCVWIGASFNANTFNSLAGWDDTWKPSGTMQVLSKNSDAATVSVPSTFTYATGPNNSTSAFLIALKPLAGTAAITGTATASITEADVVTGGKTIIATLTGETYVPASGHAALAYVGGQVGGFAGTTSPQTISFSLAGGLASAPAAGDFVIIGYTVGSTANRSLAIRNTGAVDYTLIDSELYQDDTYDCNLRVAYRFMPSPTETQFVLTETVSGGTGSVQDAGRYYVQVWRNVDTGTPMDVAAVPGGATNTMIVNPGAIQPTTAGAKICVIGAGAAATGGTYTAGYLTDFRAGSTSDTNDAQIGGGYLDWTSGSYDPAAFGGGGTDSTNDSWCSMTIAIRPAATTPFADARAAFRDGITSAQAEAAGWNAKVRPNIPLGNIVRTSDTVATATLQAQADYDITAQETVTDTIPGSILAMGDQIVATPTFTVDTAAGGTALTGDAAIVTETVPSQTLTPGSAALSGAAAIATPTVPAQTLAPGVKSLDGAAPSLTPTVPAQTLAPGTKSLDGVAGAPSWAFPGQSLVPGSKALDGPAGPATWAIPDQSLSGGGPGSQTLDGAAGITGWTCPSQSLTPGSAPLDGVAGNSSWAIPGQSLAGGTVLPPPVGTVPVRYLVGMIPNVVPVETVLIAAPGVVPVREFVGPANVVPVREAPAEVPRVKVIKV